MPMDYDSRLHGPVHWPMPFEGCWLRQADAPDRETYWRLAGGQLSATTFVRSSEPAEGHQIVRLDSGDEVVWLDVAEPAASQALFRLDGAGVMSRLDHVRVRP